MTFQGTSQTLDSATSIPNQQLRKAINLIEKGKITQQELDTTKKLVSVLNERITVKDSIIYQYKQKDTLWQKIDSVNNNKILNLKTIINNDNQIISIQNKTIRRQKLFTYLKIAAASVIGYYIHK